MSKVLRVLCLAAMVGYSALLAVIVVLGGMSPVEVRVDQSLILLALVPFVYLVLCLVSSFVDNHRALLLFGIIAHVIVLPFIVMCFWNGEFAFVGLGGLAVAAVWVKMYQEKRQRG